MGKHRSNAQWLKVTVNTKAHQLHSPGCHVPENVGGSFSYLERPEQNKEQQRDLKLATGLGEPLTFKSVSGNSMHLDQDEAHLALEVSANSKWFHERGLCCMEHTLGTWEHWPSWTRECCKWCFLISKKQRKKREAIWSSNLLLIKRNPSCPSKGSPAPWTGWCCGLGKQAT